MFFYKYFLLRAPTNTTTRYYDFTATHLCSRDESEDRGPLAVAEGFLDEEDGDDPENNTFIRSGGGAAGKKKEASDQEGKDGGIPSIKVCVSIIMLLLMMMGKIECVLIELVRIIGVSELN